MKRTVELDVFSGRPNPSWTLSISQLNELEERLAELKEAASATITAPQLGYRGIVIKSNDDEILRAFGTLVIFNNRFFADPKREFERWLVLTGHDHLPTSWLVGILQDWQIST